LRRHHLHPAFPLQHVDRAEGVADVAGQHLLACREALAAEAEIDIGLVGEEASCGFGALLSGFRGGEQQRNRPGATAQFLLDPVAVAAEAGQRQAGGEGAVTPQFVAFADQAGGPAEFRRALIRNGRQRQSAGQGRDQPPQQCAIARRRFHCARSARTRKAGLK
jgi:hypothetical protein